MGTGPEVWGVIGALVAVVTAMFAFLLRWNKSNRDEADKRVSQFLMAINEHVRLMVDQAISTSTVLKATSESLLALRDEIRETVREMVRKCPGVTKGSDGA